MASDSKPLTKTQLVQELVERMNENSEGESSFKKDDIKLFLQVLADLMIEETRNKEAFTLPGVGKVKLVNSKAREGRNPATGETIQIPARQNVKFRIAKGFKDSILS